MELLPSAAMDFSRRRWKVLVLAAAAAGSSYCAYRMYNLPAMVERRKKMARFLGAFLSLAKAVSASAETVAIVSDDLNYFLRSDSSEIPSSLKQLSKIVVSEEIASSVSKISEALTVGMIKGIAASESGSGEEKELTFLERLQDKLFSESGTGFASVVVGSLAKNMVMALFSLENQTRAISASSSPEWLDLIQSEKFRQLIGHCIQIFVGTAMAVYLDKTIHINTYDELFSGLTKPEHEAKVRNLLVSVCSAAMETLVKTSHQVMQTRPTRASSSWTDREEDAEAEIEIRHRSVDSGLKDDGGGHGWVDKVSSALAVPSNRSLVLDLTGRVTSETVRSSLEFFLCKLREAANNGVKIVREEIVDRGMKTMRYAAAKTLIVFGLFLALFFRFFSRSGLDLSQTSNNLLI